MPAMKFEAKDLLVVLSTFPNIEDAGGVAHTLVGESLCACVNILPHVRSIYKWNGEIANNAECLCLIKTSGEVHEALVARLRELHPYDVPEIVTLLARDVDEGYLRWVLDEVALPGQGPGQVQGQDGPAEAGAEAAAGPGEPTHA